MKDRRSGKGCEGGRVHNREEGGGRRRRGAKCSTDV
jgi:hypothetical protein